MSHEGIAPEPIRWRSGNLELLDQTRLPHVVRYERMYSAADVRDAIRALKVRGAPAIGIAAAYGVSVAMQAAGCTTRAAFEQALDENCSLIAAARPTAVNLTWAVLRLQRAVARSSATTVAALLEVLVTEAEAIHAEDRVICQAIGRHGRALITPGSGTLTHCNAGALAVSELGTATAPLYLAHRDGVAFRVYVDETRPLLQGSRLTAWELGRAGIDVTLICDNAAARLMAEGLIDRVIVGTDRVTANGDVVNKIGTAPLAIVAHHFGVPFYVACPSSTFDVATATGADVVIEERAHQEVTHYAGNDVAAPGVKVRNPAFDVTPQTLVSGFVTDRGLITPPYDLPAVFRTGA
jgi:methylthioribose-1-phosphate isomerase